MLSVPIVTRNIVTRNTRSEWLVAFAGCTAMFAFMMVYHDLWRAKPYSLVTANECTAQGAIFGICAALALGPLSRFFGSARGLHLRRTFGLAGVAYTVVHILLAVYLLLTKLGWKYCTENWLMLIIGIGAAALLAKLAYFSFEKNLKRLGVERWRKLQLLGYLALFLALMHFLVLGKVSGWMEWYRTMNHPLPPGSLPLCILGSVPFVLKGAERFLGLRESNAPHGITEAFTQHE